MANDKDAKVEQARKYADAGQYVKAIEAWRQLLDETPNNDANVWNTIGDLCLKKKSNSDAADAYSKAARFYLQEGFHLKAIALYKKILKLEPNRAEIYTLLGDLNVVRGLMNNAIADYLSGAKLYLKTGQAMNALTLFRKITKVDPKNTDMRLRVAELCLKEKLTDEAINEYLRIGLEYQRLERADDARKLYEQVLSLSPNHAEARRRLDTPYQPGMEEPEPAPAIEEISASAMQSAAELEIPTAAPAPAAPAAGEMPTLQEAKSALAAGDVAEAERMIRLLLVGDPDKDEFQAVLGMVYLRKGHASIAFDILHPIAKSWLEANRSQEAQELIDAFLAVEADDADFLALKAGGAPAAAPALEISLDLDMTPSPAAAPAASGDLSGGIEFNLDEVELPSPVVPTPSVEMPELQMETSEPAIVFEPVAVLVPAAPAVEKSAADLDAVFEAFRQGVKGQVGDEDFETHYDIGIAYKEMGLTNEAIEEFQLAARGQTRFVDACTMIAACYKDQQLIPSAIAFLERALADNRCGGPGVPYIKYDLAVLYEENGQADKAGQLYADIPSILDVEDRHRRLLGKDEVVGQAPSGGKRPVSYL